MMKLHARMKLFALAVSASLALTACGGGGTPNADEAESHSLTIAVDLTPPGGWDPAGWAWGKYSQVQQAAYASLLNATADGEFVPGLATEWAWDDNRTFSMTLREGVTFTDGAEFNSEAVKANLEYFKASDGRSATLLATLDDVEVVSDTQLVLHWSAPMPDLQFMFSQHIGMMVSPEALAAPEILKSEPVGAGPYSYILSESIAENTFTFEKNEDYWDAESVPYDRMVFRIIEDAQAAYSAVQSGEVDVSWGSAENLEAAESAGLNVFEGGGPTVAMYFVDQQGADVPALGNVLVRRALNYAIDREAIAENLMPGRPTSQVFVPDTEAYDPELDDYYTYDPQKAKDLLAEAGYGDGLELTATTFPGLANVVSAMAGYFADVGVTLTIDTMPFAEFVQTSIAGNNTLTVTTLSSQSTVPDVEGLLLPNGSRNARGASDSKINELYAEALEQPEGPRRETFQKISKISVENAWMVVVLQEIGFTFYNDEVTNLERPAGHMKPSIFSMQPTG